MRNTLLAVVALTILALFAACDSFVSDAEGPIDLVEDERLNDPEQVPFVINGVLARFASTFDIAGVLSGGLSDELVFDRDVGTATFSTYEEIDNGDITLDNNSVDAFYNDLGELRFFADDLVQRVENDVEFDDSEQALREEALYIGQFYGGVARYFYAAYFGLDRGQGGGVINAGEFIPSAQMYDLATADLDSARATGFVEEGSYEDRLINSLIARNYLYKAELTDDPQAAYEQARAYAQEGLEQGDDPFQTLYNTQATNDFYFDAGPGRAQYVADARFGEGYEESTVLEAPDPDAAASVLGEQGRLAVYTIEGESGATYYEQALYLERSSPINFMTWQENALMLAELALRLDNDEDRALELVNSVRASHSLEPFDSIALTGNGVNEPGEENTILVERDKELFVTGARLIDQRRFDRFHLGEGTWQYLPITASEREQNENL